MLKTLLPLLIALLALPAQAGDLKGKKVLFVNSYHEGYPWSDGVEKGAKESLEAMHATTKILRMDTKRHGDDAFRKEAALKVKAEIEAWKPDAVILSDDPAVKYLLVPYFKDAALPFVFCGVNWEASKYGLPFKNATGMVEVALLKEMMAQLGEVAKGKRLGYLTIDSETERAELAATKQFAGVNFTEEKMVKTMADWKAAFTKLQGDVDILILGNNAGAPDWNDAEAAAFAAAGSKVVSGTINDWMMPYTMVGFTKVPEEQGQWAVGAVADILGGKAPSAIPVTANKKAKVLLNVKMAGKAGVIFKPEVVRAATIVN
jgi:ABC-type uncharacterized transport system substrate-binding protein